MSRRAVLAEIVFSGPRAGHWHSREVQAFAAHITMAGQIWADYFVPALAPDARIEAAGVSVSADRLREAIRRGYRATRPLPAYRPGRKVRSQSVADDRRGQSREEFAPPAGAFTVPKLEEAANAAHCGGPSCAYGFMCNCRCPHCGGARVREI